MTDFRVLRSAEERFHSASPSRTTSVPTAKSTRTSLPRPLFIGIPGPVADAVSHYVRASAAFPMLCDRSTVDAVDTLSSSYRPFHRGRPRVRCLTWTLATHVPEVLVSGGYRPEDRYIEALYPGHDRWGPPNPWLGELVVHPDVIVHTCWPDQETDWDLPVAPDVPCLQLRRDEHGEVLPCNTTTWARRRCPDCILAAGTAKDSTGCETGLSPTQLLRLMDTVASGRRGPDEDQSVWPDCVCSLGADREVQDCVLGAMPSRKRERFR